MGGDDPGGIRVEVVYATLDRQRVVAITIKEGASLAEAIAESGITAEFPEIDLNVNRVGIFGKVARLNDRLVDGDRVEIYRALQIDPKEARRSRAQKKLKGAKAARRFRR